MIGWAWGERHEGGGLLGICQGDYSFSLIFLIYILSAWRCFSQCFIWANDASEIEVSLLCKWGWCLTCYWSVLFVWLFHIYLPPLLQEWQTSCEWMRWLHLHCSQSDRCRSNTNLLSSFCCKPFHSHTKAVPQQFTFFFIDPQAFKIWSLLPQTGPTWAALGMLLESHF